MPASIFNGTAVKILKDILKFKTGTLIITGETADPTSVAFDAPQNSIYLQSGTTNIYKKLDSGLTTNWQLIGSTVGAASSTDNAIARFDGTTGKIIQNSAVTVDDSGNITTSGTVDGRDVSTDGSTLDSHLNGGASKHDANEVDYERADGSKKNIQAASDDVEAVVSDLDDAIGALASTPTNYVPSNAAIVASHLAAIDSAIGSAISTINMFEFQDSVISATILTPPGSPSTGDRYLINGVGLSGWSGQDNKIAEWNGSAWIYTNPTTGMFVASDAESDKLYLYGGASWSAKNFEATTASGFLSKTGFDIQLTNLSSQNIIVGSAGNVATSVDTSSLGDISASTTGGLEIKPGAIVDADINASAAIGVNKLAALTTQRAIVTDASGVLTPSSTTDAQIGYLDTLTSNVQSQLNNKADASALTAHESDTSTHGVTGAILGTTDTQVVTNKDVDGGTASNTSRITLPKASTSTLEALTRKEATVMFDTDLNKPVFDNGSILKPFDSNVFGKSFYSDYACHDVSLVSTYDDTTADPVDLTGGTATGLTVTSETTTPLTGTKSYKFSKDAANRRGKGFALITDETLDFTVKQGESVTVKFKFQSSANYVSGDIKMYIYRVGSNTLEALNGVDGLGAFGNSLNADQTGRGEFTATISCSSSDTAIRVGWHIATTNESAYDLTVDNVFVGTSTQLYNSLQTEWTSFTPTGGWNTNTTYTGRYKRNGDQLYCDINVSLSGAPNSADLTINLPSGLVIDTTKMASSVLELTKLDSSGGIGDSGGRIISAMAYYYNTTSIIVVADNSTTTPAKVTQAVPITFGSGDTVNIKFSVPIVGWSAGNTISSTQANFQNITARYSTNTAQGIANAVTNDFVDFEDEHYDDFNTVTTGGDWKFTAPVKGQYFINTTIFLTTSGNWTSGEVAILYVAINNSEFRQIDAWICQVTGTHQCALSGNAILKLNQGDYIQIAPYQNSGASINLSGSAGENFIEITQIPDMTVVGISGAPYERISASITSVTATTLADTRTDVTGGSIPVTPGKWKIGYKVATRIQRIGTTGEAYGRVNIADPAGAIMEQTISIVGNSNMAASESLYGTNSAYQIVDVTTTGTYKLQITANAADSAQVMHVIANTYGFFSGADADSEIYAERIR